MADEDCHRTTDEWIRHLDTKIDDQVRNLDASKADNKDVTALIDRVKILEERTTKLLIKQASIAGGMGVAITVIKFLLTGTW